MPLGVDKSDFLEEKVKRSEQTIRQRDERIAALETENAMLYLKLAQCQGSAQHERQKSTRLLQMIKLDHDYKERVSQELIDLSKQVKVLKQDLSTMKAAVRQMPPEMALMLEGFKRQTLKVQRMFMSENRGLEGLQKRIQELEVSLATANERHAREKKRRQMLHNTLVELRGNIRVHCRVRPLMPFDTGSDETSTLGRQGTLSEQVVHVVDDETVVVKASSRPGQGTKAFEYERVYAPLECQDAVFEEVQPLLTSLLDGYNVCIMAYGQTGSGKTHTMLGPPQSKDYGYHNEEQHNPQEGVIPKATRELFRLLAEKPPDTHTVEVSVVEIYNNDIRDLLGGDDRKHDVLTAGDGSLDVPSLTYRTVEGVQQVMELVQYGMKHRAEDATLIHSHSSRSHLIVTLTVTVNSGVVTPTSPITDYNVFAVPQSAPPKSERGRRTLPVPSSPSPIPHHMHSKTRSRSPSPARPPTPINCFKTKLQLVDLAGSECVGMSGVTGAALRETSYINKSLSALADVLGALAEHRAHVPYRNARLTHMLQDSIGGDAKLLVMCCVSPAQRYLSESLQCLGFGQRARQVQRGPIKRKFIAAGPAIDTGRSSPRPTSALSRKGLQTI
ncbi:kinesin-like protein KIF25 [Branchiostoma floridae x Branchiostoma belcheri]